MTGNIKGSWRKESPKEAFGLDLNDPSTLRRYNQKFTNAGDFGAFLAFEYGFDLFFREIIGRYIIMPFFMSNYNPEFMSRDLCSMMWFTTNR